MRSYEQVGDMMKRQVSWERLYRGSVKCGSPIGRLASQVTAWIRGEDLGYRGSGGGAERELDSR